MTALSYPLWQLIEVLAEEEVRIYLREIALPGKDSAPPDPNPPATAAMEETA